MELPRLLKNKRNGEADTPNHLLNKRVTGVCGTVQAPISPIPGRSHPASLAPPCSGISQGNWLLQPKNKLRNPKK